MKLSRLKHDSKAELNLNALQITTRDIVAAKVASGEYSFEEVECPICSSKEQDEIGKKDRYGLLFHTNVCKACGLVLTNPRMTQDSYNRFYNDEYRKLYVGTETATISFFDGQRRKGKKIYDYLQSNKLIGDKPLHVLEIGCGAGGILDYFKEKGNTIKGIDLGAEYVTYGKENHQLDLEVNTLSQLENTIAPDVIIYSHVLEHILDVKEEIQAIKKIAKEGTVVYIEVPGVKELHKNYASNILKYLQNAHTYHFTLESLVNLMGVNGLELIVGNQFVQGVFKLSSDSFKLKSDYASVSDYIESTEKNRWKYILTIHGFKTTMKNLLIKFLDATGTRKLAKAIWSPGKV